MQNVTEEREGKLTAYYRKFSDLEIIRPEKTQLQTACSALLLPGRAVTTCLFSPFTVHRKR